MDHQTKELFQELTTWRQSHRPPTPLPESLWERAVELAQRLGVCATAKALRLDYAALKRRLEQNSGVQAATFVELFQPSPSDRATECVLEMQSGRGARLRIEGARLGVADLVSLVRLFAD